MITGGPVPPSCRRRRERKAAWIILALVMCASPLAGMAFHLLPPFWAILVCVGLLFLLLVLGLAGLPASNATRKEE